MPLENLTETDASRRGEYGRRKKFYDEETINPKLREEHEKDGWIYISSGLRECSRFWELTRLTCLRPCLRVLAPLPLTPYAEEHELRDVAEVKADASSIRTPISPYLVPNDVGLVGEPPG